MESHAHEAASEDSQYGTDDIYTGSAGRACEACNKKKTKCDRQQPVCGLCRRTNHACVFPLSRKRPSRTDPTVKAKMRKIDDNIDRLLEILEANPGTDTSDPSFDEVYAPRRTDGGQQTNGAAILRSNSSMTLLATPTDTPPADGTVSTVMPSTSNHPRHMGQIPFELAIHLLDLYFDKIQPWCGLLHKPTFLRWSQNILNKDHDALRGLEAHERALFYAIFSLAARFSNHSLLASFHPRDRGTEFAREAEQCLKEAEDFEDPSNIYLQACILIAHYQYYAGSSKKAWKSTLTCIRTCYDLGLHEVDIDEDSDHENDETEMQWILREQQRRLFWAIWEIDLFSCILKRRPLGIAWRHIRVKLPVSDEVWFSGQKVGSGCFIEGPECWKSLSDVPNQCERAWAILSKSVIGYFADVALLKEQITAEQKSSYENNLSCFRLSMPESLHLSSLWINSDQSIVQRNFAVATNLYLSASACIVAQLPVSNDPHVRNREEHDAQQMATYRDRARDLSHIMRKWTPECVRCAPPSLACCLLTFNESLVKLLPPSEFDSSYDDLCRLILARFAERWTIAAIILRIRELAHDKRNMANNVDSDLIKEYPVYFRKFVSWKQDSKHPTTNLTTKPHGVPDGLESNGIKSPPDSSMSSSQHASPLISLTQSPLPPDPGVKSIHPDANTNSILPAAVAATSLSPSVLQSVSRSDQPVTGLSAETRNAPEYFDIQHATGTTTGVDTNNSAEIDNTYADMDAGVSDMYPNPTNIDILEPTSIPGFSSVTTLGHSPQDFDALFSGFLQEPLWQDFQTVNFLV